MQKPLNVLYIASEAQPFNTTGTIAELAGNLPKSVKTLGHEIRVMLPGYGFINERRHHVHHLLRMKDIEIPMNGRMERAYVKSSYLACDNKKVQVYFLSNDHYFDRSGLYFHPDTKEYFTDNDERFIFFCRGVFESLKKLGWQPDIIHCNDWQCGLVPAYLKTIYKDDPFFKNTRTVFTAFSLASHGTFPKSTFEKTGLPFGTYGGNGGTKLNFMNIGLSYADAVTTFGNKVDKKALQSVEDGFTDHYAVNKKSVISMMPSQAANSHDEIAEKFIDIYRGLLKN